MSENKLSTARREGVGAGAKPRPRGSGGVHAAVIIEARRRHHHGGGGNEARHCALSLHQLLRRPSRASGDGENQHGDERAASIGSNISRRNQ